MIEIQLLWSTWDSVCGMIEPFRNGTKGEYVDVFGNITDPSSDKIGLFYNNDHEGWIIQEGYWIIKDDENGKISYMTDLEYKRLKKIQEIESYI